MLSFTEFERLLKTLSPEEFTAFVIDLWEDRGHEIRIKEKAIIAESNLTKTHRVHVIHNDDPPVDPVVKSVNPDILVTNTDSEQLRILADQVDARYIGPRKLYELILYAIDRENKQRLIQRYFSRSVHDVPQYHYSVDGTLDRTATNAEEQLNESNSSSRNSAARTSDDYGSKSNDSLGLRFLPYDTFLLLVFILGVLIGTIALASMAGGIPGMISLSGDHRLLGNAGSDRTIDQYPAGVGSEGITNVTSIARTHQSLISNRSYSLIISHHGSRGTLVTNFRWQSSHQHLRVNDSHDFFYRVNGTLPPRTIGDSPRNISFIEYANGPRCRHRATNYTETHLRVDNCQITLEYDRESHFAHLATTYLLWFLDTPHSSVQVVRTDSGLRYRVIATGTPVRLTGDMNDYRGYSAVALIDQSGIVLELQVRYTLQGVGDPRTVTFELRFTRIGTRTITAHLPPSVTMPIANVAEMFAMSFIGMNHR